MRISKHMVLSGFAPPPFLGRDPRGEYQKSISPETIRAVETWLTRAKERRSNIDEVRLQRLFRSAVFRVSNVSSRESLFAARIGRSSLDCRLN